MSYICFTQNLRQMKELVIRFLKKNWFKVGIALFLLIVAFQDELSFNINLNNPSQQPTKKELPTGKPSKQEILSSDQEMEMEKKPNHFDLQPILPGWRKKTKEQEPTAKSSRAEKDDIKSLAKLVTIEPEELDVFIRRFSHVAISEQKKYGIPASVIIGNSLLLSTANHSELAQDHLNFFQLPCTPEWDGRRVQLFGNCYREYDTAWLSFRDHSNYLTLLKRVNQVDLSPTDYKGWAKFLDQQNFGQEKDFGKQLIQLIEDMELYYLDRS